MIIIIMIIIIITIIIIINKDSIKPPNFSLIFQTKNVKAVKGGIVANPEVNSYQHFRTVYIDERCFFPFFKIKYPNNDGLAVGNNGKTQVAFVLFSV